jgi:AsmA protein
VKIDGGTVAMRDAAGQTTTLALTQLSAQEAAPDAPLSLTLDASYNGAPVSLTADTGPLAGLLVAAGAPWPVKLAITAAGAKLGVEGTVGQPAAGRGLAIALTADIPDLAALSPLAGTTLPPLKTIAAQLKLADTDGGNGIAISDLKLTLPNADLAGSLSVQRGARPLVKANLSARQIDLDALTRAMSAPAPTGLPVGEPGKPAAPDTEAGRSGRVIPATKLPFEALRLADGDIQLAVDDLRTGGQDYQSIKLHAETKDGHLTLDPLTLDAPGGRVDVKATVDANPAALLVTLTLRAPNLALQPLLKALGKPGYASGTLELRADLRGTGDTPHAIAASLDGAVGAAVAKGEIDSKLLGSLMSNLVQKTDLAQLANKAGMSALNCFAVRLDSTGGIGTVRALRLDSSTLGMTGSGTLNFDTEALDLHLRPSAGLAGTNITAPVIVAGTFADPSAHADVAGTVIDNAGTAAKLALGASTGGLALIIGSEIDRKLSGDPCAGPLALARFSQPPAASNQSDGSTPPASQPPAKRANNPADALKKLFQ